MKTEQWRLVQTKTKNWFIVAFSDGKHNSFGQPKDRYDYVSVPMSLEKARAMLKKLEIGK